MSRHERLTGSQLHKKFPQFETDDTYTALYENQAGLVYAAMAISVHVQLARAHGASIIDNCPVRRVDKAPNGHIRVSTTGAGPRSQRYRQLSSEASRQSTQWSHTGEMDFLIDIRIYMYDKNEQFSNLD